MRPKQHETRGSGDLFRARLDQISDFPDLSEPGRVRS
jgi:hypothetical protein